MNHLNAIFVALTLPSAPNYKLTSLFGVSVSVEHRTELNQTKTKHFQLKVKPNPFNPTSTFALYSLNECSIARSWSAQEATCGVGYKAYRNVGQSYSQTSLITLL